MPLGGLLVGGIGSILGPLIGGAIGQATSAGDKQKQLELQKQALDKILNTATPDIQSQLLDLPQFQSQGQLTPELQQAISQDKSQLSNISTDPRLAQAQMTALAKLQQLGVGGLQPQDLAALNKVQSDTSQAERAREASTIQEMQQRGAGGSGAELAARLGSSQAAANRQQQAGLDVSGQASERALQSILNAGNLGGQMQQTQFNQEAQQATAQDAINRWNAANAQSVGNTNVSAKNQAQIANLSSKQAIANANAELAAKQQIANKGLQQQQFANELQKAQAASGATAPVANSYGQQAAAQQSMWGGIGQAAGKASSALGSSMIKGNKKPVVEEEEE